MYPKRFSLIIAAISLKTVIAFLAPGIVAQTTTPAGRSTIQVRAIYEDTDRPVRRAEVQLFSEDQPRQTRGGVTDGKGEFTFKNLDAGSYRVLIGLPGNRNGYSGVRENTAKSVTVDGISSAEITVRTARGGAITGKVTYPDGEPAIGAQVKVLTRSGKQWSYASFIEAGAQTDDRGIYRIYPLETGDYVVSVTEQSLVIEERDSGATQTVGNKSLNPYYYGDAPSYKTANLIHVDTGREVNNINITLAERATYKVAGTVVGGGTPLVGVNLRLEPQEEELSGRRSMKAWGLSAQSDNNGKWVFKDVPEGSYDIELDTLGLGPSQDNGPRSKFVGLQQQVVIAGADISDLVLSLSEGGRVSGSIVGEGDRPMPQGDVVSLQVLGRAISPRNQPRVTTTGASGASPTLFSIEGIPPGESFLIARVLDKNYFVKSITWNRRDLMRHPLKVAPGEEIKGVRILLSGEVSKLSGFVVTAENKKPVSHKLFVLVPVEELRWTRVDSFVPFYTDKQGAFNVSGAPGEYILLMQPPRENELMSIDHIREHAAAGPRVTLKAGQQPNVEIVVPVP